MPIASSLLNKPRLVEKLRLFYDYVQKNNGKVGTKTRGIDLNFNNACNLRCKYCFTNSPKGDHVKEFLDIGSNLSFITFCSSLSKNLVIPPSIPGTISFLIRILANVPLIIIS